LAERYEFFVKEEGRGRFAASPEQKGDNKKVLIFNSSEALRIFT
jgi:hypothetical protein